MKVYYILLLLGLFASCSSPNESEEASNDAPPDTGDQIAEPEPVNEEPVEEVLPEIQTKFDLKGGMRPLQPGTKTKILISDLGTPAVAGVSKLYIDRFENFSKKDAYIVSISDIGTGDSAINGIDCELDIATVDLATAAGVDSFIVELDRIGNSISVNCPTLGNYWFGDTAEFKLNWLNVGGKLAIEIDKPESFEMQAYTFQVRINDKAADVESGIPEIPAEDGSDTYVYYRVEGMQENDIIKAVSLPDIVAKVVKINQIDKSKNRCGDDYCDIILEFDNAPGDGDIQIEVFREPPQS